MSATNYIMLGLGLVILVKGANVLVEAASKIAKLLKIPAFIIGLFIIAIGTSAPEAAIGIISGIEGKNLITLGDVIGSSIVNITIVIGVTALVFPLEVDSSIPRREIVISIFVQLCLIIMLMTSYSLSRVEAIILLAGMVLFLGYIFVKSKKAFEKEVPISEFESEVFEYVDNQEAVLLEEICEENTIAKGSDEKTDMLSISGKEESLLKQVALFLIGLLCLIGGADLAVKGAVQIASILGLSETFIGITVVAFGTSLPELVTCLVAVYKKETDIAVGNIIGSNIFNILFVLGISALLHPITVSADISFDLFVMLSASVLLFLPAFFYSRISRRTGFVFVTAYIVYLSIKLSSLG
ncbi:MAG: calcium/sodium antiporter [Eubacteriales bacterium]|nr:calcium/sodium antiporter [Eubacteriales bacterium]